MFKKRNGGNFEGKKTPRRSIFFKKNGITTESESFIESQDVVLDDGLGHTWMFWRRRRYILILMAFLGEMNREILRTNLHIAVLPMTRNYTVIVENGTTKYVQEFNWDMKTQGYLLSVFFYGFAATFLLGGILALKFGGSMLYCVSLALTALSTLFTPAAARIHLYLLVALRIFEGMCEGVLTACLELLYAKWLPTNERCSLVAIVISGDNWGVVTGMAASSAIAYHFGWRAIFYITGSVTSIWFFVWILAIKECPALDKKISASELAYIQNSTGTKQNFGVKVSSIPFKEILTSLPFWALIIALFSHSLNYILHSTMLPAYMKDVLQLDIQHSGYMTSVPFLFKLFSIYLNAPVADFMLKRKILSSTWVRKLYISGGMAFMALSNFIIQKVNSTAAVLICLIAAEMSLGATYVQIMVNVLDLAPRYSSVLTGVLCTSTTLSGMLVPVVVGYLTQNKTAEEWNTVFSILAGMCTVAAAIYAVLGSGRLQPWATGKSAATEETQKLEENISQ